MEYGTTEDECSSKGCNMRKNTVTTQDPTHLRINVSSTFIVMLLAGICLLFPSCASQNGFREQPGLESIVVVQKPTVLIGEVTVCATKEPVMGMKVFIGGYDKQFVFTKPDGSFELVISDSLSVSASIVKVSLVVTGKLKDYKPSVRETNLVIGEINFGHQICIERLTDLEKNEIPSDPNF